MSYNRTNKQTDRQTEITTFLYRYLDKVIVDLSLSDCLFVCSIKTYSALDRFSSNFDWEVGRTIRIQAA